MNIHKYLLPASLAATMHVALLWLMPEQPYIRIIDAPLKTVPVKPPGDLPEPPVDPADRESNPDQVKPLRGKPAPPESPDVPTKLPDDQLTIPVDARPPKFEPGICAIPEKIGAENGVTGGDRCIPPHNFFAGLPGSRAWRAGAGPARLSARDEAERGRRFRAG